MKCRRKPKAYKVTWSGWNAMNKHHDNLLMNNNLCDNGSFFNCSNPMCKKFSTTLNTS